MLGNSIQKAAERRIGTLDGQGYIVQDVVRTSVGGYREVAMLELNNATIWRETLYPSIVADSQISERYLVFVGHEAYTEGCDEKHTAPPACVPAHDNWYEPDLCDLRTWYAVFTDPQDALSYAKKIKLPDGLLQRQLEIV